MHKVVDKLFFNTNADSLLTLPAHDVRTCLHKHFYGGHERLTNTNLKIKVFTCKLLLLLLSWSYKTGDKAVLISGRPLHLSVCVSLLVLAERTGHRSRGGCSRGLVWDETVTKINKGHGLLNAPLIIIESQFT